MTAATCVDGPVQAGQEERQRDEHQEAAPQATGDVYPARARLRVPRDGEERPDREERDDCRDEEALQEQRRLRVAHPSGEASIGHRVENGAGTKRPRSAYRTSYRATMLHALEPLDVVAAADDRTYHDPGRLNRHARRALPLVSVTTEMRRYGTQAVPIR